MHDTGGWVPCSDEVDLISFKYVAQCMGGGVEGKWLVTSCLYDTGGWVSCSDTGRATAVRHQHPGLARDKPETRSTFHVTVMLGKQRSTFHVTLMHIRPRWLGALQRCGFSKDAPLSFIKHAPHSILRQCMHDTGGWVPCSDEGDLILFNYVAQCMGGGRGGERARNLLSVRRRWRGALQRCGTGWHGRPDGTILPSR